MLIDHAFRIERRIPRGVGKKVDCISICIHFTVVLLRLIAAREVVAAAMTVAFDCRLVIITGIILTKAVVVVVATAAALHCDISKGVSRAAIVVLCRTTQKIEGFRRLESVQMT